MTEKRFTLSDDVGMLDVACGNIFDNGEFVGTVQLCDGDNIVTLLNEQHETIQQQKEAIEHLSYDCEYLNNNFEDYRKENEQLEEQLKNLRRLVNEAYMEGSE